MEVRGEMEKRAHIGTDNGTHHTVGLPHLNPPGPPPDELGYSVDDGSHEVGNRPKSLVGKTKGGRLVWFDPDMPEHRLSNEHLTVTGESGSGKTQSMKTIMADLHDQGIPALVLDFKDDYSEARYADREGFEVYDPTKAPLPLNPLVPPVDRETGMVNTTFHAYQLSDIVGRIYRLGDIQAYSLRQAILATYEDVGLPTGSFKPNVDQNWPQFQSVKVKLGEPRGKEKSPNGELIGRMSPIFDFGLFSSPDPKSFAAIASANTVIRLSQLPGNEVKNSVAEFFLMALYNHLVRQPQAHTLSSLLVLDEAWRVANSPFLEPLMREGRAFGLGVFVATQFPTDLPLTVSGNAASQLFFSQSDPDQVAEVERIMTGHRNTPEADRLGSTIRGLLPLQAVLHNKQYQPYATFDASPYFARGKEQPQVESSPLPRAVGPNATKHLTHDPQPVQAALYHRDKWVPRNMRVLTGPVSLVHSPHSLRAWSEDRYKKPDDEEGPPSFININPEDCFEMETDDKTGGLKKMLVRQNYDEDRDIIFALHNFLPGHATVKTMWFNHAGDLHGTLDLSPYAGPPTQRAGSEKVNPHGDTFPAKYWFEQNGGEAAVADPETFDPNRREYVEQVDGKYICQCGFSTDNEDKLCDYCRAIGNLSGMDPQGDDPEVNRVEKYRDWWKQPTTAASFPDYYGWKTADIIPFPPGRDGSVDTDDWLPPFNEMYVHEQFVQSPRNRRRQS